MEPGVVSTTGQSQVHLKPQELAERFGVPVATVYSWRVKGVGPRGFRVGKFVRYRLEDVEAWENEQIAKEAQPAG